MNYFKVYKLKQLFKLFIFIFSIAILLVFSKENFESVKQSITMFISSVAPSLFPFIFFTEFILGTEIIILLAEFIGKYIQKIFGTSKNSTIAIIIGFLCGFPMGAKAVSNIYEKGIISKKEANRLLTFVNNNNPIFILSTIGIAAFHNISIGILLLISHYLSAILIGFFGNIFNTLFIIHKKDKNLNSFNENNIKSKLIFEKKYSNISFFDLVKKSILNSFVTLGMILGFIILFNLFFSIIKVVLVNLNVDSNIIACLSGLFEVTKGIMNVSITDIPIQNKILISSFLLGFSGLCIISQIYSTVYMHKISIKNILFPKFLQGIFSFFITYILLRYGNFNITETQTVFNNSSTNIDYEYFFENLKKSYINSTLIIIAVLCIIMIINKILINKKKKDISSLHYSKLKDKKKVV